MATYKIINKNAIDALKEIPSESVDCIITSPPYYGLRNYKGADTIWDGDPNCKHNFINNFCSKCGAWKGQLGMEPTYQLYINHLMNITRELKRVLKKTGTMFWNMGDTYAGGHTGGSIYNKNRKISKLNAIPQINIGRPQSNIKQMGIKEKSLMLIPERFAMAMISDGWILRNKIIWRKINAVPSNVKDRFSNKWEYVFFFTKNKKYYFDLDAVRKPYSNKTKMILKSAKNSKYLENYVYSLTSLRSRDVLLNPLGANPGDIITTHIIPHKENHTAIYPETLITPFIKAGCPKPGVVLDPFAGSGTTGVVADILGRNSILIEISPEYCDIIKERFKKENVKKVADMLLKKGKITEAEYNEWNKQNR